MPGLVEAAPETGATEPSNPFLQFVDPMRYREMVDIVNKRAPPGRRINPLSRGGTEPADQRVQSDRSHPSPAARDAEWPCRFNRRLTCRPDPGH